MNSYIYYEKLTGNVVATHQSDGNINADYEASILGTGYATLKVDSISIPVGNIGVVTNNVLTFKIDPNYIDYSARRKIALAKLKQNLPLMTDQDIKDIFGG